MNDDSIWTGKKRLAFLVGLDEYSCEKMHRLNGCVNDIDSLEAVLSRQFDFSVLALRNGEATRDAVIAAMQALADAATPDHQVVFAWSGHGSTLGFADGGVFETLVPFDTRRGTWEGNRDITDRELFGWVWQVSEKTPHLTLIIDACHCGSIVRDFKSRPRGAEGEYGQSSKVQREKSAFTAALPPSARAPRGRSGWLPVSDRYTLLASCTSKQYCSEIEDSETGLKRGLFSYRLHRKLAELKHRATWRDLFEGVADAVTRENPKQHPQLEGNIDLEVFGQQVFRPKPFLAVLSVEGDRVSLDGGAAEGVRRGSEWSLQPPGSRAIAERSLGIVKIDAVGATRSFGALREPWTKDDDSMGLRAFEISRPADSRFRVLAAPSAAAAPGLLAAIGESGLLSLAAGTEAEGADLVLHRVAARKTCGPDDPLPQLPEIPVTSWAFVNPVSETQMAPLRHAGGKGNVEEVVATLEQLARHAFLLRLEHPDPAAAAHATVEIRGFLLEESAPGVVASQREIRQQEVLKAGDRIAFRVAHRHPAPLQVTLISLGLTGGIEILFPVRGRFEPAQPAKTLEIGFQQADALEITIPDNYPLRGEKNEASVEDQLLFLFTEQVTRNPDYRAQDPLRGRHQKDPRSTLADFAIRMTRSGPDRTGPPPDVLKDQERWGLLRWKFQLALPASG